MIYEINIEDVLTINGINTWTNLSTISSGSYLSSGAYGNGIWVIVDYGLKSIWRSINKLISFI
jgi:hypothetical protein